MKDEIIVEPRCKICNSELRTEVEELFEKRGKDNYHAIQRHLISKGMDIGAQSVRRHFVLHYIPQERAIRLKQYGESITSLMGIKRERRQNLYERLAMVTDMIYDLSSLYREANLEEQLKISDAFKRLCDTATTLEDKLEEIEKSTQSARSFVYSMSKLIGDEIKQSKDESVKNALMGVLEKLSTETSDLMVDKE
jgi:hypothetical protein